MSKNKGKRKGDTKDNTFVNIAETVSLGREKDTSESQEGYNFVGSLDNWTTLDEQRAKVKEIEKVTEENVGRVKAMENNNKGRMDLKNLDK